MKIVRISKQLPSLPFLDDEDYNDNGVSLSCLLDSNIAFQGFYIFLFETPKLSTKGPSTVFLPNLIPNRSFNSVTEFGINRSKSVNFFTNSYNLLVRIRIHEYTNIFFICPNRNVGYRINAKFRFGVNLGLITVFSKKI